MNIYFACSITGGRELEAVYQAIVQALTADDHVVPTAHLAEAGVSGREGALKPGDVYARDIAWIRGCNVVIAEVSIPSHGVGYEIGFALALHKPVLALYQQGRNVSKMISGNPDPSLLVRSYRDPSDAIAQIKNFLNNCKLCL